MNRIFQSKVMYRREKKVFPTHFLSVKINDHVIKKNLELVVENFSKVHSVKDCIIDHREYHITLDVLTLTTDDHMDTTLEIMSSLSEELKEYLVQTNSKPKLNFEGVGNFANYGIIWAGVKDDEYKSSFVDLVGAIRNRFQNAIPEVLETRNDPFTPHLTLAKRIKKYTHVRESLMQECGNWENAVFGEQSLVTIELLKMKKDGKGYYETEGHIDISTGVFNKV